MRNAPYLKLCNMFCLKGKFKYMYEQCSRKTNLSVIITCIDNKSSLPAQPCYQIFKDTVFQKFSITYCSTVQSKINL